MKVLLAYATYSSGTEFASELVEKMLATPQRWVTRKNIRDVDPKELKKYDLIIFGSPSWMVNKQDGMPHEFFVSFMEKMQGEKLTGKQFALFGLGDSAYNTFTGAVDKLTLFIQELEGMIVIEPLRIDGYYFDQQANDERLISWTKELSEKLSVR